ncbi:rhomboid family intramembrane serine protease [Nocardia bovistercoris]|uniref:Rhomboid family intramembrane serine protease n=1 Tax=Nocardia bovistercoris TaxID=2785916 RepID=A0A931N1X6_9NOCA|nr:rhomboid family intramembrane serine protease [Nocardia bovistercoris]MBH0778895.1 rhomboid family intramembrane serine protease [Nocardia bovistercoris]
MNPHPPAPTCVRHPQRPTGLACTRCGRPACPDCLRPAAVGQHCVDCLAQDQRSAPQMRTVAGASVARTPIPFVTYALIVANVVIFAITAAQARSLMDNYYGSPLFSRYMLVPRLVADGQFERVIGSGFLHWGPIHLALNMFALWVVGRNLEPGLGRSRYLAVYLVSLFGGSAASMVFQDQNTAAAGASGAVYGLFGAITVLLIRVRQNPNQMLILIGINIFISFSLPGISLSAHLGGLAAGTLATVGVLFLPQWLNARTPEAVRAIGWASIAAVAVADLAVVAAAVATLA